MPCENTYKLKHKPVLPEDALLPSLTETQRQLFHWPWLQAVFACNTELAGKNYNLIKLLQVNIGIRDYIERT